jgi:hypothetical protein
VLSGASGVPVVDDAALPFIRQHTEQWMAARAGRVTTSTFALALGFWSDEFALAHLRLPLRGRASKEARDAAARDAVSVASEDARVDAESAKSASDAATRARCLAAVDAYNAELAAAVADGDDGKLAALDAGGWAVTREHAVAAAAGGARDVACALGKEQEAAALLAVLGAFPNSYLVETGAVALGGAAANLAASPDGVLVFPALGHSDDATETTLAKVVAAGSYERLAKPKPSKQSKRSKQSKQSKQSKGADVAAYLSSPSSASAWPVPDFPQKPRVAVAVEVKVASPFVWSTSGLKSYNNQAQYKVDAACDGARDHVAPIHVPQAVLEAAALRVAGTVVVSYSPVSGGANAGASLRMRYVPRDDAYVETALRVLRANASAEKEETTTRCRDFDRLVRRTKRLASSAALVADLAPIPIPEDAEDSAFLR